MSENITPPTIDPISVGAGSSSPTDPISPQSFVNSEPKNYFYPILIIVIFLLTLGFSIFFFMRAQSLSKQVESLRPSIKPSPSPVASADPTTGWQTFSDPKLGFTFKYPSDWELTTEISDVIELMKDHARIVITYRFDALGGGPGGPSIEGSPYELSNQKVYKYKSEIGNNEVEWGISNSLIENSRIFEYAGKPYSIVLRYPSRENGEQYIAVFDQFLSTFKFTN